MTHYNSTPSAAYGINLSWSKRIRYSFDFSSEWFQDPIPGLINLALSIEVKDTNWFLHKNRTDQRAGDWSPKVIPRFTTDRIANKPMQCLRWKHAFGGPKYSVSADILGKWHQDFSGLVYQMISAYTVQMYTLHRAYVRKKRQASCNLGKKNQCIQGHIQFTHLLCEALWPHSVLIFEGSANQTHLRQGEQTLGKCH